MSKTPIFVHTPKCAGTSIIKSLGIQRCHHERASVLLSRQDPKKPSFSFSFVRNPYSRIYSAYIYVITGKGNKRDTAFGKTLNKNYNLFIKDLYKEESIRNWLHFKPMSFWIDKKIDFIGRVENLHEDFNFVCSKLNKSASLKHLNKSFSKENPNLDECSINLINDIYKEDFLMFGYKMTSTKL